MSVFIDAHIHSPHLDPTVVSLISLDPRKIDYELIEQHFFSLGIHPWWISEVDKDFVYKEIIRLKTHKNFLGMGEIGVDRHRDSNLEEQLKVFEEQMLIARDEEIGAIIFHSVHAFSDISGMVKKINYKGNLFFHDYNGNVETTEQLLQFNAYFCLGFKILDPKTKAAKSLVKIPLDRLFLETDNFDVALQELYRHTAEVKKITLETLQKQIILNTNTIFGKKIPF